MDTDVEIIEFILARIGDEEDRARYAAEAYPTDVSWWAFTEPLSGGRDSATRGHSGTLTNTAPSKS